MSAAEAAEALLPLPRAMSATEAPQGTRDQDPSSHNENPPTRSESPGARARTAEPRTDHDGRRGPRPGRPTPRPPEIERGDDRIGELLGSYKLVELIGKGGMGFVYRAEHVKLGREVALKVLRADYAKRRESVARFFQEARAVNRIRHRNIVDVTDFVELDDGTTFIIMELLRGQSLGKWARDGFDTTRALALLIQICDGLSAAHAVGIVHRDLKPDNVIVMSSGGNGPELIKLLDFGVAKLLNREDEDFGLETAAGSVIGTPAYMSPEQAGGLPIDGRSDIYSLGAIMYELFCGQPLFRARSFGEYVRKHLNELPTPPRQTFAGSTMDERLEAVIMRCLEKAPAARFASTAAMRDELIALLGGIDTQQALLAQLAYDDTDRRWTPGGRPIGSTGPVPRIGASSTGPHTPLSGSGVRSSDSRRAPRELPPEALALDDEDLAPRPPTGRRASRRGTSVTTLLLAGLAMTAVVGGLLLYAGTRGGAAPARVVPRAPAPPVARVEPPPAPEVTPSVVVVPEVEPVGPAVTPPRPAREVATVQVLFSSTPRAHVYAAGSATSLCDTPCWVAIDLQDGGNPHHRDFVVRKSGHRDAKVTIDLARPPERLSIILDKRSGSSDVEGTEGTGGGEVTEVPATPEPADLPAADSPATPPPGPDSPPADPLTTPPGDRDGPPDTPRKKPPKVDPSDTIDPFG